MRSGDRPSPADPLQPVGAPSDVGAPMDCVSLSESDGYVVVDLVAWNVAFDSVVFRHAPVFNTTLMVDVVV